MQKKFANFTKACIFYHVPRLTDFQTPRGDSRPTFSPRAFAHGSDAEENFHLPLSAALEAVRVPLLAEGRHDPSQACMGRRGMVGRGSGTPSSGGCPKGGRQPPSPPALALPCQPGGPRHRAAALVAQLPCPPERRMRKDQSIIHEKNGLDERLLDS